MTNTQLNNLQVEYENTPITVKELCDKYSTTTKELKGYTKWKPYVHIPKPSEVLIVPETPKPSEVQIVPEPINPKIIQNINNFKDRAVAYALESITDPQYLEIKEFKDLVSIVDTIEKSVKPKDNDQAPTVNILIQNLMEKFSDDC